MSLPSTLPAIPKSPLQELIELKDGRGRDIREIVLELYAGCRSLPQAAEILSERVGRKISDRTLYAWMTQEWGWSIERVVVLPDEPAEVS